jgi:hypothetical protein
VRHPTRREGNPIRGHYPLADLDLTELSPVFDRMYAPDGWLSIPLERLLKASIRSQAQVDDVWHVELPGAVPILR